MKIYCVGGAVRDALLGLPVVDRDWVVVGGTQADMLALGYRQVGKDFPVFLHPDTSEEYALARKERKIGPGYHGFEFDTGAGVTLEEDLSRRDLTINAIAQDSDGKIIDPFGGQADLRNKQLRHISSHFTEDPVRILRVARFAARFAPLGFQIAPETLAFMQQMVQAGEVDALVPERSWKEFEKALVTQAPQVFLSTLHAVGALAKIAPEIESLYGVPQNPEHHPEIDTGKHIELVLQQATLLSNDPVVRFAALVHDLGKAQTPKNNWPNHSGHEQRGIPILKQLAERLKIPNPYLDLAKLVVAYHGECHDVMKKTPDELLQLIYTLDPFRKPDRFQQFFTACLADCRGRPGWETVDYPQVHYLDAAVNQVKQVSARDILAKQPNLQGEAIKSALWSQQLAILQDWMSRRQ